MKFSNLSQLALASSLAAPSLAATLRGAPDAAERKLAPPRSSECTLQVAALLEIPGSSTLDDVSIECEMDPADARGQSGQHRRVAGSAGQMAALKGMVADGSLVPGQSTLELSAPGVGVDDGNVFLPPGFDVKAGVKKGKKKKGENPFGRRLAVVTGDKVSSHGRPPRCTCF